MQCTTTQVADLSILKGMPLTCLDIRGTPVRILSALAGLPLTYLRCDQTKVTDLSPILNMPLKELRCDFKPERDAAILKTIKTLETINGKPVAEFWKQ